MTPRQIIARAVCCLNSGKCGNETCGVPCGQLGTIPTPSLMTADAILAALGAAGLAVVPVEATQKCPFEDPTFSMDPAVPCPVCGDLGTLDAEFSGRCPPKHVAAQAPGDG